MINEKGIALRYLKAQRKRSILLIFGVVLAIALISSVFSLINAVVDFDIAYESANGIWHVGVYGCTSQQAAEISKRLDVTSSGQAVQFTETVSSGEAKGIVLCGGDVGGAKQLNFILQKGKMPDKTDEIALEQWTLKKIKPGAAVGDKITITYEDKTQKEYVLSGILKDNNVNIQEDYYRAAISLGEAERLNKSDQIVEFVQVKSGINIDQFCKQIASDYQINKKNIAQHTRLLALIGRTSNQSVMQIYYVGAFLAGLVVFSAIMMIYNAFNISVVQRIRQFGLLRAMGATPKQIRRVVKYEAGFISLFGVLPGLLLGIVTSSLLIAFIRIVLPEYFFFDAPPVYVSWVSLLIGAVTGIGATMISSLLPARKAGKVSPIEALSSESGKKIRRKTARGITTKLVPVEAAISVRRQMVRKVSFVMTSLSLSFGILLVLCFNPFIDMLSIGTEHNFDMGDMYVAVDKNSSGFSEKMIDSLAQIKGIADVSPKTFGTVDATFSYSLLGNEYKEGVKSGKWKSVENDTDGYVKTKSKSTVIGMQDEDLKDLSSRVLFGHIDPDQMNRENGIVLAINYAGSVNISDLRPGDNIKIGSVYYKIEAVIKTEALMYSYNESPLLGFYTTNQIFSRLASGNPKLVTMTLRNGADSDAVFKQVKSAVSGIKNVECHEQHESKDMANKVMLIGNVFIFGFIAVIAVIGVLNIINTMSTNIIVRTREIGLLRAAGMTMGQVGAMVFGEAALYGLLALVIGLGVGIPLEHWFFNFTVKSIYSIPWGLPWNLILAASIISLSAVLLAIIMPLRYVKKIVITQAVSVD